MKQTPFTEKHIALGAKMADFAGFNMPISYTGIKDEHATVRENAGVFDVSHMGSILVKGPNALALIQKTTTNDASKLEENQAQYTCFTNEEGGILDDFIVYCIEKDNLYLLVVNASNVDKDWAWLEKHNDVNAELENISPNTGILAIQGPKALDIIQELTPVDLSKQKYFHFEKSTFAGVEDVLISATGYTGSGGVEIYFKNKGDNAEKIWSELFRVGEPKGLKPIGLGARDTLRLEKGYCLYGNDLNEETNPLEAGLGWVTKLNSKDFIGKEKIQAIKDAGLERKLVGIELLERGIPRQGYTLVDADNNEIGVITSGTQSPSLNKAIAMAYVQTDLAKEGQELFIQIRNKPVKAQIVRMPFL